MTESSDLLNALHAGKQHELCAENERCERQGAKARDARCGVQQILVGPAGSGRRDRAGEQDYGRDGGEYEAGKQRWDNRRVVVREVWPSDETEARKRHDGTMSEIYRAKHCAEEN